MAESKLEKILKYSLGYLRRPYLWRDLFRQPYRIVQRRRPREASGGAARQWVEQNAVDTTQGLELLGCQSSKEDDSQYVLSSLAHQEERCSDKAADFGGGGDVELLFHVCISERPELVVETGVAAGRSSFAILLALQKNDRGQLYSVDRPDMRQKNDDYIGVLVPECLRSRWQLVRGVDRDKIHVKKLREIGEIDVAHYDSDKSYYGRSWAYQELWSQLRAGGLLLSDDIVDNTAFRDFCSVKDRVPVVIRGRSGGFVGAVRK